MKNTLRYRVNFGNGQVEDVESKKAGYAVIAAMDLYQDAAFIEFQDPDTGDWFPIGA
jgi:hypothetical protein